VFTLARRDTLLVANFGRSRTSHALPDGPWDVLVTTPTAPGVAGTTVDLPAGTGLLLRRRTTGSD